MSFRFSVLNVYGTEGNISGARFWENEMKRVAVLLNHLTECLDKVEQSRKKKISKWLDCFGELPSGVCCC